MNFSRLCLKLNRFICNQQSVLPIHCCNRIPPAVRRSCLVLLLLLLLLLLLHLLLLSSVGLPHLLLLGTPLSLLIPLSSSKSPFLCLINPYVHVHRQMQSLLQPYPNCRSHVMFVGTCSLVGVAHAGHDVQWGCVGARLIEVVDKNLSLRASTDNIYHASLSRHGGGLQVFEGRRTERESCSFDLQRRFDRYRGLEEVMVAG